MRSSSSCSFLAFIDLAIPPLSTSAPFLFLNSLESRHFKIRSVGYGHGGHWTVPSLESEQSLSDSASSQESVAPQLEGTATDMENEPLSSLHNQN